MSSTPEYKSFERADNFFGSYCGFFSLKLVKKYIDDQLIRNEKIYIFSSHRDEDANEFELNLIRLADV